MKVHYKTKKDFKRLRKILRGYSHLSPEKRMDKVGQIVTEALAENTPVSTGELASGWDYKLEKEKGGCTISVYNTAHSETGDNSLVKMLEYGHGTGTGGYVRPRPFVERTMNSLNPIIMEEVGGVLKDVE